MAQQTAVEWLVEQLLIYGDKAFNKEISLGQYHIKKQELIEQAKQMEKEQTEISDEEIEKAAAHHEPMVTRRAWVSACKWYREQLKQKL